MKSLLLTLVGFGIFIGIHAQSPKVAWAMSIGGAGNDRANSVETDSKGNIVIVGRFQSSSIDLGRAKLAKNVEDSADVADVFIIKLDKSGEPLWAQSAGKKGDDHATSCVTDRYDNIYVVGWFESDTLTFGDIELIRKTAKGCDMFVAKFSPIGGCVWARNAGGEGSNGDYSTIALDNQGNVIVSGIFGRLMVFEDGKQLSTEQSTMFVAKYDENGTILWAKNAVGRGEGQGIGTDREGNIYVGGHFYTPTFAFDDIVIQNNGVETNDAFIAKYSANGEVLWARNFGGTGYEFGTSEADRSGNSYVAGIFMSDSIQADTKTLVNMSDNGNIFVAKYDSKGHQLWAHSAGGQAGAGAREFYVTAEGEVYVTGSNFSDFNFGGSRVRNVNGSEDIFVLKYDVHGNEKWALGFGGSGRNAGRGVTSDKDGHLYLTGSFDERMLRVGNYLLMNAGDSDIFLVKFIDPEN